MWKANVINTTVSLKPYILYNLPYKGTNTLKHTQTQLAYMRQQETLVRNEKLKITK